MSIFDKINIDPVTFEILRHRLFAINDEAAATLRLVSGSPVANEAFDFNTGIMDADGGVCVLGIYIGIHAISIEDVTRYIAVEYKDNPGIGPDDMFICNDPYLGAMHQSDVVLTAPIHYNGELIAWTGAVIHQVDVGGSVRGSQCSLGAESIFQEAPPMPPLKIIEKGVLRKDIKQEYLRRSRLPDVVELDLRAKIAANNTTKKRILETIKEYGADTVKAAIAAIREYTEMRFRERLKELPDGTWRHTYCLEYENKVYPCHMSMEKSGDHLVFDLAGTADQAPAVVNCTYAGAKAGIVVALLQYLCYDMPWSPAGIEKAIEVKSKPGTILSVRWPGGISKSTTGGVQASMQLASVCLGKLLSSSKNYLDRVMAGWVGGFGTLELFGTNQRDEPFGSVLLESLVGGSGATAFADGVDTGGMLHSISCCKANAETYEFRYPFIYIFSRQQTDSGGAGKYRGGMGYSSIYVPHKVEKIPWCLLLTFNPENSESSGLMGGYPGGGVVFSFKRNSDILDSFKKGVMPGEMTEIQGKLEKVPPQLITEIGPRDVLFRQTAGGGGYGDPLERDPEMVQDDVLNGAVSIKAAKQLFGVVIDGKTLKVKAKATDNQRVKIKAVRAKEFHPV
ncbi:MAG: hydantoinase B/oxoprolinase family protein [Dehalococcoidia bacterium]|nr:hydantoinase B/oxoprolinase family protein [Dehalococcoidia bacterium]